MSFAGTGRRLYSILGVNVMPTVCEFTQYAQDIMGENWYPYKFERALGGVIMTGAVCPLKQNGEPNFRKRDRDTICRIIYPIKE